MEVNRIMISPKSVFIFILLILLQTLFVQKSEAISPSVEFIVDFSESMKEMVGDKSKIEIAREVVSRVLDEIHQPLDVGLTFYGHTGKDKCHDVELVVPIKGFDPDTMKKKLMETEPKGKAPIALALKRAAQRLKKGKDYRSIILITDGKMTCKGDLVKTAREIKQELDFRVIFHVIAVNPTRRNRIQLRHVSYAGYGTYHEIKNISDIKGVVKDIAKVVNNPEIHVPKVISLEDMVLIPAGKFFMGSAKPGDDPNEYPRHLVYLDAFYMDRYEVTQRQFKEVMGYNPSLWIGSDLPVDRVSWYEAKEYCERVGKRLPTEAEWEKAAKGGRDDRWAGTSDLEELREYAWIHDTGAGGRTHPVGEKRPNGYGIYDMCGNVWEWVADWFGLDYYKISPKKNPKGPDKGAFRILRGACWDSHQYEARTTSRYAKSPDVKYANNGFRCARSAK